MYGMTIVIGPRVREYYTGPIFIPSKHKKNFHAWNQPPKGPRK